MPLEIAEDVLYHIRIPLRNFQRRISAAIVHAVDHGARRCKQAIEVSLDRLIDGFDVGNAAIMIDRQVSHVAGSAAYAIENSSAKIRAGILFSESRLEVVQKIEFEVIDNRGIKFILARDRVGWRRGAYLVLRAVKHHAGRSGDLLPGTGGHEVGIVHFQSHFFVQRADHEFANRDCAAFGKERLHTQVKVDALDVRSIKRTGWTCRDGTVVDPFALERQGY